MRTTSPGSNACKLQPPGQTEAAEDPSANSGPGRTRFARKWCRVCQKFDEYRSEPCLPVGMLYFCVDTGVALFIRHTILWRKAAPNRAQHCHLFNAAICLENLLVSSFAGHEISAHLSDLSNSRRVKDRDVLRPQTSSEIHFS